MDEYEQKLEELKLSIQIWHHHDSMYWSRFSIFVTLIVIGIGSLGLIYTSQTKDNIILGLISLYLSIIGILWWFLLRRPLYWALKYIERSKEIQETLCNEFKSNINIMMDPPSKFLWRKTPSYVIIRFILVTGVVLFTALTIYFFFLFK